MIDHAAVIDGYCRDVISGAVPACRLVRLACQRHLNDIAQQDDPQFPYVFDTRAVRAVCRFAELFPHVKGDWAGRAELLSLQPWECFVLGVPFGWKRKVDGARRFREIYAEIPRKNGKSILGAVIGNYMFIGDGEFAAEVYSGATSQKQAWEVYGPARQMMLKSPDLCEDADVEISARNMCCVEDRSKFEPLIGNPGDGANVSCAIIDEYHEHITSSQYDTMVTGTGARVQPMIAIITTAGFSITTPCYDKHREAVLALEGVVPNDRLFAIIYSIDEEDDWTTEAALRKANPNYGVSVSADFLLSAQQDAIVNTHNQNRFKTKHLNVWCSTRAAWMNMEKFIKCGDPLLTEEQFLGESCVFSLDLASKSDLCAYLKLFWRNIGEVRHFYAFMRCYLPSAEIENLDANAAAYRRWRESGRLVITDGATVDYATIAEDVIEDAKKFNPRELVYDPFNATHFAQLVAGEGVPVVEFLQRPQNFAVPMDEVLSLVKDGVFHFDANDMLTWMIANVAMRPVRKGLFAPTKEKPENKIDGAVALIMAHAIVPKVEVVGSIRWV